MIGVELIAVSEVIGKMEMKLQCVFLWYCSVYSYFAFIAVIITAVQETLCAFSHLGIYRKVPIVTTPRK